MAVCGEPWGRVFSKDENGNAVRIVSQRYPLLSLRFGYLGRANHQESAAATYVLDARQMTKREHWPVQLPRPVEHREVVEDVVGALMFHLKRTEASWLQRQRQPNGIIRCGAVREHAFANAESGKC